MVFVLELNEWVSALEAPIWAWSREKAKKKKREEKIINKAKVYLFIYFLLVFFEKFESLRLKFHAH